MVDRAEVAKARREDEELPARPVVPHEPALVRKKWRLPEPAREPRERGLDTSPEPVPDWDAWNRWADERIRSALTEHEAAMAEAVGESLGSAPAGIRNLDELERRMRAEAAETLARRCGEILGRLDALTAEVRDKGRT